MVSDIFLCASIYQNQSNRLELISSDDGMNWSEGTSILPNVSACNPATATFKGELYVAYQPWTTKVVGQLYLASSPDGVTWNANPTCIGPNIGGPRSTMAVLGNKLVIVYQEINTARLCIIWSEDGYNWTAPAYIGSYKTQTAPAIATENGLIYLVFQNTSTYQLELMTSSDGVTWSTPSVLCNGAQACNPSIAAFDGDIFLVYQPWSGKVVGQLFYGYYGAGLPWQYSGPISTSIGGNPPSLSASDAGLCVLFQEINSAKLCCMMKPAGEAWSSADYVDGDVTITGPASCTIPYASRVSRQLRAKVPQSVAVSPVPDTPDFNAIIYEDSYYNWNNRVQQDDWGFTGIVNWCTTSTKTISTFSPGNIVIFPGSNRNKNPSTYAGGSQINGKYSPPIIRGKVPPQTNALHAQLCNLLMPENFDGGISAYMNNFVGFAYSTPQGADGIYDLQYVSGQLNWPHFVLLNKDGTPTTKKAKNLSPGWQSWLAAACSAAFKQ